MVCQHHIEKRFSNFRFQCTDTFSPRYNPAGKFRAADLQFPYENERFDVAFAASVYTHMLPEEIANFIRETARVLRPGGLSFATFCLLNDRTLPFVASGKSTPPLPHAFFGSRVRDIGNPSSFIALPEASIRDLYSKAALRILGPILYGSWAGPVDHQEVSNSYGFNQDIVVSAKASLSTRE